jgi:hypothetical protein
LLPAPVAEALRRIGPASLKDDSTCRAQFRDINTGIVERDRQGRLLPAALSDQIAAIGARSDAPASPTRAIAGKIGIEPAA